MGYAVIMGIYGEAATTVSYEGDFEFSSGSKSNLD
jgi:hypothetical protein